MALLMDQKVNNGLPANLSGAKAERQPINHGFKAIQIGCSAWAAEALKLTMPASAFSRSTECHNQDKVSMGTIAARDCVRILELTEQVVVSSLLAASQGARLRSEMNQEQLPLAISKMVEDVGRDFEFLEEDRALEKELRFWLAEVREKRWDLYSSR
jgi:histidine ammonia-lyase